MVFSACDMVSGRLFTHLTVTSPSSRFYCAGTVSVSGPIPIKRFLSHLFESGQYANMYLTWRWLPIINDQNMRCLMFTSLINVSIKNQKADVCNS